VKQEEVHIANTDAVGRGAKELWMPAPGAAMGERFLTHEMIDDRLHFPKMNGKKVFTAAVEKMCEVLVECLKANRTNVNDVDLFFFHQANLRINDAVGKILEIPEEKVFNTIQRYGNTTAATIPLGMDIAIKEGKLKKGMLVATVAFGSGYTWAAGLFRY